MAVLAVAQAPQEERKRSLPLLAAGVVLIVVVGTIFRLNLQ